MSLEGTGFSHGPADPDCRCAQCELTGVLTSYLILYMDPTDRALRLAGDICPATVTA